MTTTERPVLVLGATGGQGGAVIDALSGADAALRALVRDPNSASARRLSDRGIEVVAGSLDDRDSLTAAMRQVSSVFALTTPFEAGPDAEIEQGRAILGAAGAAGVPHLVFSSVAGADQDSGVPHFESKAVVERQITAGDVPYTILGPTYFFDNALGGEQDIRNGVLALPLPGNRPLQQLARRDLGEFAAQILLAPQPFVGRRIELASDDPTPAQMATALSASLGSAVHHLQTPLSEVDNNDMLAMWTFLGGTGYRVDLAALHADHPNVGWTSFADWSVQTLGASS